MENLEPMAGYDLYAPYYKKDHALLDSFDWGIAGTWWKEAYLQLAARGPATSEKPVRLLDAGCGDGRTLAKHEKWLGGRKEAFLQGFDISPAMVKLSDRSLKTAVITVLDVESPQDRAAWVKKNGRSDLVSAFFLLVHVRDMRVFFEGMTDLLAPGGLLLMNSIPQKKPPVLHAGVKKFTIRAHHHNPDRVREAGRDAGLHLEREQQVIEDDQVISTVFWWSAR